MDQVDDQFQREKQLNESTMNESILNAEQRANDVDVFELVQENRKTK